MDELSAVEDALRSALSAGCAGTSATEQLERLRAIERCRRLLDAVDVDTVAEADLDGTCHAFGRPTTVDLLAVELLLTPREARDRVGRARELGPRRDLAGASLPPVLAATSQALRAAEVSGEQASVVLRAVRDVPSDVEVEAAGPVEAFLLTAARYEDARRLRRSAALVLERLDPDGRPPRGDDRRRRLDLATDKDGWVTLRGQLTPDVGLALQTVLDALSAPRPAQDGACDDRSATQRRHDAVGEVAQRLLRSGTLPDAGGTPVTVVVRTTPDDLTDPAGTVTTEHGAVLSWHWVRGLGDEVVLMPVAIDHRGAVLRCGRGKRLATPAQRRALALRDGGCSFPGCTRPASWCQVNHVVRWEDGGSTDLDNLHLLCGYHHRSFERAGWQVRMVEGVPEWLPPRSVDPARRPVRNRAHHVTRIDFAAARSG